MHERVSAYQRLQVSNIDNPNLSSILLVSEMHLLPGLGKLDGVDPLVISRVTDVVEVVVHARIAFTVDFVRDRETLNIAAIVIAPEKSDVVGDLHSLLVVAPHLLQQCYYLLVIYPMGIQLVCDRIYNQHYSCHIRPIGILTL